jgi:phosphate/sulfate permease
MMPMILASSELGPAFIYACVVLAIGMLLWDTVEVGRNDAANLVNAVFGARILPRHIAVWIAGIGVVLGATLSSSVIDTARKGIFDPTMLTLFQAFAVYTAVYIVDTVLLYSYSAFGMPVSTTACLVFELLGASFALGSFGIVHWHSAGMVISGIVCSIAISGIVGFAVQRLLRLAIGDGGQSYAKLRWHGWWSAGFMLAILTYFMLTKGMSSISFVRSIKGYVDEPHEAVAIILVLWAIYAILIQVLLLSLRQKAAYYLFPTLAIAGMISMGFAFGQNDLANCASPGLASWNLFKAWHNGFADPVAQATRVDVRQWLLLCCGFLLLVGMTTQNAQRVTRAEVNTGSMSNTVGLWSPRWCIGIARFFVGRHKPKVSLAPAPPDVSPRKAGKLMHYDPLRACVILTVSPSVIATASHLGLPVSTTYIAFAAVIATGAADRIMQRGDADLKIARTIWVVFSWFASAIIAAVAAGLVALAINAIGVAGIVAGVAVNLAIRWYMRRTADAQEKRVRAETRRRRHPERFADAHGAHEARA